MNVKRLIAELLDPELRKANQTAAKNNADWLGKIEAGNAYFQHPRVIERMPFWSPAEDSWVFTNDSPVPEGSSILFRHGRGGLRGDTGIVGKSTAHAEGVWTYLVNFENEWNEDE